MRKGIEGVSDARQKMCENQIINSRFILNLSKFIQNEICYPATLPISHVFLPVHTEHDDTFSLLRRRGNHVMPELQPHNLRPR